jgi:hypothetical protein
VEKTITPSGATFVVATQMSPSHHELDRPGAEWKMIVRHGKHATRPGNNGVNTVVLPVLEQVVSLILSLKADTFVLPVHCQNSRCSSFAQRCAPLRPCNEPAARRYGSKSSADDAEPRTSARPAPLVGGQIGSFQVNE